MTAATPVPVAPAPSAGLPRGPWLGIVKADGRASLLAFLPRLLPALSKLTRRRDRHVVRKEKAKKGLKLFTTAPSSSETRERGPSRGSPFSSSLSLPRNSAASVTADCGNNGSPCYVKAHLPRGSTEHPRSPPPHSLRVHARRRLRRCLPTLYYGSTNSMHLDLEKNTHMQTRERKL